MNTIHYAAALAKQAEGGFTVTFPDIPEAITEGDTIEEARFNAAEALSLALSVRIELGDVIPTPTPPVGANSMEWVEPDAAVQAAMLVRTTRGSRPLADLARALGTSWPAAQRLENPRHSPTLKQLERAAAALGKRLILAFE